MPKYALEDTLRIAKESSEIYIAHKFIETKFIEEIEVSKTARKSRYYGDEQTKTKSIFEKKNIWKFTKPLEADENFKSVPTPTPSTTHFAKSPSNKVFIVHGRDRKPLRELKSVLKKLKLLPIVLHEQPSGSRTIVEKLEKYSDVGYALVILTPDDKRIFDYQELDDNIRSVSAKMSNCSIQTLKAREEGEIKKVEELTREFIINALKLENQTSSLLGSFKSRARQNVVLEFGYFIGLLGRDRVCCLYKGKVELPSDMHGIVYIPFNKSVNEVRDKIVKELKAAGYEIKI